MLSVKVKEIQTRAQFCVNISMYFIDKIIQKKHWDQADDFKWASYVMKSTVIYTLITNSNILNSKDQYMCL